jgi:hypothetical protein
MSPWSRKRGSLSVDLAIGLVAGLGLGLLRGSNVLNFAATATAAWLILGILAIWIVSTLDLEGVDGFKDDPR